MRHPTFFFLFLALVAGLGLPAIPGIAQPAVPPAATPVPGLPHWQWQAPQPTGYELSAFQALTDSSMIAVGTHGTALKTTDAGRHWQVLPTGTNRTLTSISFVDSVRGWVTGPSPVTNPARQWRAGPGRVLRTTTGGRTWAAQVFEPVLSVWYPEVAAASATIACVAYETGRMNPQVNIGEDLGPRMRRTTNGGLTWAVVTPTTPDGFAFYHITKLAFVSSTVGFVFGQLGGGSRFLLRTADAGLTWQTVATDSATGFKPVDYFFLDAQRGWMTGYNTLTAANSLWRTSDGGLTWTQLPTPLNTNTGMLTGIGYMSFADPAHGIAINPVNSAILVTADSGRTYAEVAPVPGSNLFSPAMWLGPGGRGWWVGHNGIIGTTADYGQSWQRRAPTGPLLGRALDLTMTDPTHGWARPFIFNDVAATTSVLRTTTRGNAWPQLNLALRTTSVSWLSAQLLAAAFPDRDTAWVGGQDWANNVGFVLRTADGGTTWTRQTLPAAPPDVTELATWDARRVVAIGSGQALYVTRDAGQTWARAVVPGTRPLKRATWADSATIYVTTDSTTLLKSIDAGRTWQLLTPANFSGDRFGRGTKLAFTSALVGYWTGGENVARTTDGGLTWTGTQGGFELIRTPGRSGSGLDLRSLTFRNAREGWVVGQTDVFRTQDAGQTWALQAFVGADITAGGGAAAGIDQSVLVDHYNAFNAGTGITRYSEKYLQTDATASQRRAFCTTDTLTLAFDTTGVFTPAERDFRVELSNRMGRFRPNETTILPLIGPATASPLRAALPAGLAGSSRYRVRVIRADSSVLGGDNERDLTIYPRPAAVAVAPADSARFCAGDSVLLTAPAGFGQYQWSSGDTARAVWVSAASVLTVRVAGGGGCFGPASRPVTVRVTPRPAAPTIQMQTAGIVILTSSAATGNQWYFNGSPIPGATGPTYAVTTSAQNGTYTVRMTVRGCVSPASLAQVVNVTGLADDEAADGGVRLAPNPAGSVVSVRSGAGLQTVTISDLAGRTVAQVAGHGAGAVAVPVAALPAGTYLVAATLADGRTQTRRLLIAH